MKATIVEIKREFFKASINFSTKFEEKVSMFITLDSKIPKGNNRKTRKRINNTMVILLFFIFLFPF